MSFTGQHFGITTYHHLTHKHAVSADSHGIRCRKMKLLKSDGTSLTLLRSHRHAFFPLFSSRTLQKIHSFSENLRSICEVNLRSICHPHKKQVITSECGLARPAGALRESWIKRVKELVSSVQDLLWPPQHFHRP